MRQQISIIKMQNFFIYNETFTNGFKILFIDISYLICILSGIFVIISKNPIVSVLFLIGLFSSVSCYLILIGIDFIGLSYILVYVGAISILFLFILMLINVRVSELFNDTRNSIFLAVLVGIFFNYTLYEILPYNITTLNITGLINEFLYNKVVSSIDVDIPYLNKSNIMYVTSKSWDGNLLEITNIISIGNIMYTNYSIWLILGSIILLLAMVGAIVITIKQKN